MLKLNTGVGHVRRPHYDRHVSCDDGSKVTEKTHQLASHERITAAYIQNSRFVLDPDFLKYCQVYVNDAISTTTKTGKYIP